MKTRMLLLVTCTIALAATAALATQVIPRTPRELAAESALIVDGKVTGVRSYWNADRSRISTEVTVAVGETYKGTGAATVRVVQPGGVVGNVRMTAHGALSWRRGEDVLLFLEPSVPGAFQVAGFSQGKFAVERDARTGRAFVLASSAAEAGDTGAAGTKRTTIEQFINQVLPTE